jgi:hypothetical protein
VTVCCSNTSSLRHSLNLYKRQHALNLHAISAFALLQQESYYRWPLLSMTATLMGYNITDISTHSLNKLIMASFYVSLIFN